MLHFSVYSVVYGLNVYCLESRIYEDIRNGLIVLVAGRGIAAESPPDIYSAALQRIARPDAGGAPHINIKQVIQYRPWSRIFN